ncbi:TVP38/TMEM64 family protein [Bacillus sp. DTU_2020_1000418_1_SI_GHA_SEK_038]|uniref:TVP38/TMEM64 family protein n=1 Tax=Bacillus sp. DTU_2020_1000418_1_SI_GHA_SEK_038 TaxID=3077585 RepID=UPI0028F10318|nr:TVP38/TMEM64 family protein [Bacillus sp. DTU_2020_1000418_1_SI_GHA_SEK_038]WNS76802.1 TVP38/TMEM64 family protein [Bacillus sp. DTU_2020_1000418_1_SI_GHA_SEK_038]
MDLEWLKDWFTLEHIMELIDKYRSFGPLPGILLPMIEAFLPFLPLFLFVMANANAFGLWLGFLFSWIGATLGALLVFILVRKYGQRRVLRMLRKHSQVQKLMAWVERHGFGPLFILICFPFTPSAVVNIVAGLSKISIAQYMLAVLTGKLVMIFTISFIGYDIKSLITQPIRSAIVGVIIFILWYVGKRIEIKMNIKMERERDYQE